VVARNDPRVQPPGKLNLPENQRRLFSSMKARQPKPQNTSRAAMHALVHSSCGMFKSKPGEKPFAEEWAEYKREEKELEEAKFICMARAGVSPASRNS
jgi:hypothetical protein